MDKTFVLFFVIPSVAGAVFLILGGIFWQVALNRRKKSGVVSIDDWEKTGGKVLTARLEQHESQHADKAGKHIDIAFEPIIEYVYQVKDVEYQGNKVFAGLAEKMGEEDAKEIMQSYSANSYVQVRYDPNNPADSALLPHPDHASNTMITAYLLVAFGSSVCCFTLFMGLIFVGAII